MDDVADAGRRPSQPFEPSLPSGFTTFDPAPVSWMGKGSMGEGALDAHFAGLETGLEVEETDDLRWDEWILGRSRAAGRWPARRFNAGATWTQQLPVRPSPGLGSVALSLCTTAHPLYTRFTNTFGASIYEMMMRPSPILPRPPHRARPYSRARSLHATHGFPSRQSAVAEARSRRQFRAVQTGRSAVPYRSTLH